MTDETKDPSPTTTIGLFSKTEHALAEMAKKAADHTFDCSTTAGDKEARASRMQLVQLRSEVESLRKEKKAPHLEAARAIDAEAARVTDKILAIEAPIDALIRATEKKKADEKAARELAERARLKAQDAALLALSMTPTTVIHADIPTLKATLLQVQNMDMESFDEDYTERAKHARLQVVGSLSQMLNAAEQRQAEADKMAAERAENERIAAEAAERRAAEERGRQAQLAAEAREREVAEQQRREQLEREDRLARQAREQQIERDVVRQTIRIFPAGLVGQDEEAIRQAISHDVLNRPCPEGWPEDDARGYEKDQDEALAKVRQLHQAAIDANARELERAEERAREKKLAEEDQARLEAERAAVEATRREQEAEAERQRQQREREQREREEAERQQLAAIEANIIATASLVDAAKNALVLLIDLDQADHLITRTLDAAIARHGSPA